MNKYILMAIIVISFILGYGIAQIFTPEFIDRITEDTEIVTDVERDTIIVERIEEIEVPDTVVIRDTEIIYIETENDVTKSRINFSDNFIVASHYIDHTGDLIDSRFEYMLKQRLVRDITDTQVITNTITTTRTVTRTIQPSNMITSSVIASPNIFAGTIGFKHASSGLGISVGQDFVNDDPIFMITYEFTPTDVIRRILPF